MRVLSLLLTSAALACLSGAAYGNGPETDLGGRVWASPLSGHAWRIRTISPVQGFGDVESNALLVAGQRESVLIDTPATVPQTVSILNWADTTLGRPVRHLIVTHWHADRMGGIDAAVERGIATYGNGRTIALAKQHGLTPPGRELRDEAHLVLSGVSLESFYPGHGHTIDNIVVWVPGERILHGGCFVKAAAATNLGNMEEISVPAWRKGIATVIKRYDSAAIVIPGHGAVGGRELLEATAHLLNAAR